MRLNWQKFLGIIVVLACLGGVLLVGCTHRQARVDSPVAEINTFSAVGGDTVPRRWWKAFDDSILDYLVRRALRGNLSLKQSWNRLAEARAQVRSESSELWPSVDVTAGYSKRKSRQSGVTNTSESKELGLSAGYELDLWGKIQSSVEAARYGTKASRQDLRAAAISLVSEVTLTWFQLVENYARKYTLREQLETNKKVLKLVKTRFKHGKVRASDVLRQRNLLASTRERLEGVITFIRVLEHKLAVLVGRVPNNQVNPVRISLPEMPDFPETGVPSEVINRRPDVRSAFLQVKAADRSVAAALAARYPRFSISGGLSTSAGEGVTLFDEWLQRLAADLALPLLDGGARQARISRSRAVLARRINAYHESILTAYREIENAIEREKQQKKQLALLRERLKNERQTVVRLRSQYLNGTTNYLDVLNALESKQQLERNLVSARRQLLEHRVALYRALAGGFKLNEKIFTNK